MQKIYSKAKKNEYLMQNFIDVRDKSASYSRHFTDHRNIISLSPNNAAHYYNKS